MGNTQLSRMLLIKIRDIGLDCLGFIVLNLGPEMENKIRSIKIKFDSPAV